MLIFALRHRCLSIRSRSTVFGCQESADPTSGIYVGKYVESIKYIVRLFCLRGGSMTLYRLVATPMVQAELCLLDMNGKTSAKTASKNL